MSGTEIERQEMHCVGRIHGTVRGRRIMGFGQYLDLLVELRKSGKKDGKNVHF